MKGRPSGFLEFLDGLYTLTQSSLGGVYLGTDMEKVGEIFRLGGNLPAKTYEN